MAPNYEARKGLLSETYGLFIPGTINTGAQISAARLADPSLREESFYVSNVPFLTKRKGRVFLGIGMTPSAFDVVFGGDINAVCSEMIRSWYTRLDEAKREQILLLEKKREVIFVEPKALGLSAFMEEPRCFTIPTERYSRSITGARAPFVAAGFGSGDVFKAVMKDLLEKGITEITIYTMYPEYAENRLKDGEMVAQVGLLEGRGNARFDSGFPCVEADDIWLRGVLREPSRTGSAESLEERV